MMNRLYTILVGLLVALIFIAALGPRPDSNIRLNFDPSSISVDLETYLSKMEAKVANLRDNAHKQIIWYDPTSKSLTDFVVVYLHGFSASKVEIAPVPQNIAKALGANLFLTRLKGHGRDGDAMGEATLSDWANDTKQAIEIGKRLGKKVILLSTSTGSTLSVWASSEPSLAKSIHSIVSLSSNFQIKNASIGLLNMPWAETVLPLILGSERSFEPINAAHAAGWTTKYPSTAVFPMAALLRVVSMINYSNIMIPHFFIYSNEDKVVDSEMTKLVYDDWGGQKDFLIVDDAADHFKHVITGDVLSPNTNKKITNAIVEWVIAN